LSKEDTLAKQHYYDLTRLPLYGGHGEKPPDVTDAVNQAIEVITKKGACQIESIQTNVVQAFESENTIYAGMILVSIHYSCGTDD
jgi:hypothetical protein